MAWGFGVAARDDRESLVTGAFTETLTLGQGESRRSLSSQGDWDAFSALYDGQGRLVWALGGGGAGVDLGASVACLPSGDALVAGYITGTVRFETGRAEFEMLEAEDSAVFLARYTDGHLSWIRQVAAIDMQTFETLQPGQSPLELSALSDGSCWLGGRFEGVIVLGPGTAAETQIEARGEQDMFLARYDAAGALLLAISAGGSGQTFALAVDAEPGIGCAVCGGFSATSRFGRDAEEIEVLSAGSSDAFAARYAEDGSLLWVRTAGGASALWDWCSSVGLLPDGSVLTSGDFSATAAFGQGASRTELSTSREHDVFLARYDARGDLEWARQLGGYARSYGMADLEGGSCLLATKFFDSIEIGSQRLDSSGQADILILRYDASGEPIWAKRAGGVGMDLPNEIAASQERCFHTGGLSAAATFGPGEEFETLLPSWGEWTFYLASLGL